MGNRKRPDFLRISNRPTRYIKRESLEDKEITFESLRWYYEDKEWMLDYIDTFEEDLKTIRDMPPFAAVQYIRKKVGYDCFLREYAQGRGIKDEELFEVLAELEERSKNYKSLDAWLAAIEVYNRQIREQQKYQKDNREGVRLLTMHGAKGLEFDTVFIIGANEGNSPHKKAVLVSEIEEERRIFYVAFTRAKRQLIISYVKEKNGKDCNPSRFIEMLIDHSSSIESNS